MLTVNDIQLFIFSRGFCDFEFEIEITMLKHLNKILLFQDSSQEGATVVFVCGAIIVVAVLLFIWLGAWLTKLTIRDIKKLEMDLNNARDEYFDSLAKLKNNPANPDLKQQTLAHGRVYSDLTRKKHGQDKTITLYDEVALMNDINAACAGVNKTFNQSTVTSQSIEERIAKLSELKEKNLISEQEYNERRQKILDEI